MVSFKYFDFDILGNSKVIAFEDGRGKLVIDI